MRIIGRKDYPGLASLYLAELRDNPDLMVEFVDTVEPGVPKKDKWVMMISTQFGCAVGCRMCDAGALGYRGNLTAEEMLAQVRHIAAQNPELDILRHPKVKIHFARMGEPALNPEVLEALRRLSAEFPGKGIIPTVSTIAPRSPMVGRFMDELLEIKDRFFSNGRFQLQISLHSASDDERSDITPIKKWGMEEIAAYGSRFVKPGDRKVTLNFALSGNGVRSSFVTSRRQVTNEDLTPLPFAPDKFLIKITPVNPTAKADKNQATYVWNDAPGSIQQTADELRRAGFEVILSPSAPEEIAAATSCGQLWSEVLQKRAAVSLKNEESEAKSYITQENLAQKAEFWMTDIKKCLRRHCAVPPKKTGLLVIDLQDFALNIHSPAYLPPARAIVPNVMELVRAFRSAERPVYFTVHAYQDLIQEGGLMTEWWNHVCLAGTPEARISPVFEAQENQIFRKCRYSAFSNPLLEKTLRQDGIENLVIAGILTNLCVESTVRAAFDLGFRTFVTADATAAHKEELHLASLKNLAWGFSEVMLTKDILEGLKTKEILNV